MIIYNKTVGGEEVITQHCSMVKLRHAEPGYTELSSLVKGRDKVERK
jgi:hypothetical protein